MGPELRERTMGGPRPSPPLRREPPPLNARNRRPPPGTAAPKRREPPPAPGNRRPPPGTAAPRPGTAALNARTPRIGQERRDELLGGQSRSKRPRPDLRFQARGHGAQLTAVAQAI